MFNKIKWLLCLLVLTLTALVSILPSTVSASHLPAPDRLPVGKCIGGLIYVGLTVTNAGAPAGSMDNPYSSIGQGITAANAAGANRCVIVLPGQYPSPTHVSGLTNGVDVYGYSSVVTFTAEQSVYVVQNLHSQIVGIDIKGAAIFVESDNFSFNGFRIIQGDISGLSLLPQILITNSADNVTFSQNLITGFTKSDALVEILNGSNNVRISENRFRDNLNAANAALALIAVENSGSPIGRIVIEKNTIRDNKSMLGSFSVRDMPPDVFGTDKTLGWMPLVRTIDSYTDITNNIFRQNQSETLITAMTRQKVSAHETRILGNVFVGNIMNTEESLSNAGPLVHLFNMQRIYFVNNTVGNNNLTIGGSTFGMIIGRGDDIDGNEGTPNSGSLTSVDARWEVHNNFVYFNIAEGGLVNDMDDQGGVGCTNLANEVNRGAQNNWVSKTGFLGLNNNYGVCSNAFNTAANNNVTVDPFPADPSLTRYIVGGDDPFNPAYYALIYPPYRLDGGAAEPNRGVDLGRDDYVLATFPEFANGVDVRNALRRNDGNADANPFIDIGAYERTPLILAPTIAQAGNEDQTIVFDVIDETYLKGSFPPYQFQIIDYPEYYGTHCDARFTEAARGIAIDVLDDNTAMIAYCPPADFHTTSVTPGFNVAGASFRFRLTDGAYNVGESTVGYTVNPVNDNVLTTVLGNDSPAGDIVAVSVGLGRSDSARLRPYVSFDENPFGSDFVFSEGTNALEPNAQNEVDYDFTYPSLPVLDNTYSGALNAALLQNALTWVDQQRGIIGFNLTGAPTTGEARARFSYTVQDSRGGSVTNFITVRAVVPPAPFVLLTPANNSRIPRPEQMSGFTWQVATNAQTYGFQLAQELDASNSVVLFSGTFTAGADGDAVSCDASTCTLAASSLGGIAWSSGFYRWDVAAYNEGVSTVASNSPFRFEVAPGTELISNGSFEVAGAKPKFAQGWKPVNTHRKTKRLCRPGVAFEGECAFRFKSGQTPGTQVLSQVIKGVTFTVGDTLTLSFYADRSQLSKGSRVMVKVFYKNKVKKLKVPITKGTGAYSPFGGVYTLIKSKVKKVKVVVQMPLGAKGRFFIDNVSLIHDTTAR